MKQLAIFRHAKSDWGNPGLTDFDRPLNKRGRKAAKKVGRELKSRGLALDQIVCSPATRAKETVERFAVGYESVPAVSYEPKLYMCSTGTLIEIINALPDEAGTVMIVGHNPGFHDIVLRMTRPDGNGMREKVGANYPTGAFALIDFPVGSWAEVEPATGEIRQVIFPRELRRPEEY
ncbi:MAG TPA: histidine phosphatase family protein [Sphingomicrobium sp.]|nr:histidine phosphatase family protein [Sphingomicrobium sp.]